MPHDPAVCIEDAINACRLLLEFTKSMTEAEYIHDLKTKSAVERQFEIIGEAFNRIKNISSNILESISNWKQIIGFRNVIAHGYDVIEDEIVWDLIQNGVPKLLNQLEDLLSHYS